MADRVNNKIQRKNFNGRYVEFAYGYSPSEGIFNNSEFAVKLINRVRTYDGSNLKFSYGVQLAELVDFSLSAGLFSYNKLSVGADGTLEELAEKNSPGNFMPYISTNSMFTIGVDNAKANSNCDFMNCYRAEDELLKIGFNRLFYADLDNILLNGSVGYEKRIGSSFFTVGTNINLGIGWVKQFEFSGDSTTSSLSWGYEYQSPIFINKISRNFAGNIHISEQLRYYAGQKKKIAQGRAARNLSGGYLVTEGAYQLVLDNNFTEQTQFAINERSSKFRLGLGGGFQKVVGSRYYLDLQILTFLFNPKESSPALQMTINFGFAK